MKENENEYEVTYRNQEDKKYFVKISEIKTEGGVYSFYRAGRLYYSVPVDLVEQVRIVE